MGLISFRFILLSYMKVYGTWEYFCFYYGIAIERNFRENWCFGI